MESTDLASRHRWLQQIINAAGAREKSPVRGSGKTELANTSVTITTGGEACRLERLSFRESVRNKLVINIIETFGRHSGAVPEGETDAWSGQHHITIVAHWQLAVRSRVLSYLPRTLSPSQRTAKESAVEVCEAITTSLLAASLLPIASVSNHGSGC